MFSLCNHLSPVTLTAISGSGRGLFTSPGDPVFYLHHAMIDRVWWAWQMLDPAHRVYGLSEDVVAGTRTSLNSPPSDNVTLDTIIDLGYAAGPAIRLGDLLSTTGGPFCYTYEQADFTKVTEACDIL